MSYAPLPTAAQVGVTRQLIFSKQGAIATAEEQIQDYEARIVELRSKITAIRHEIEAHEAYLAPVRRLPFEVLGEIVTLCSTEPDAPVQVLRDLASICKTWRDATLRTPRAWTKINIHLTPQVRYLHCLLDISRPRLKLGSLRDVQEWYDRSGSCRKDVSLSGSTGDLRPVIDLILSRASELRSLRAPHLCEPELLLYATASLEKLGISPFNLDNSFMSALARVSPRLSSLKLNRGLEANGLLGPVQTQLKSLVIDDVTPRDLFAILRADGGFVQLQALSFSFDPYTSQSPISDLSIVTLPHLRSLFVSVKDISVPVLQLLQLPQLESLALRVNRFGQRPSTKEVAAFLCFPGNHDLQLRELRLENLWISDSDLLRLLKRTPLLELLAIVKGKTSDKVVSALTIKQSRPSRWICPSLSRICIIADSSLKSNKSRVSQGGMGALITARLRANLTPLRGPPPVARLVNVRLDEDDVVFNNILSLDWSWQHDQEPELADIYNINPSEYLYDGGRWWHFASCL